MLSVSIFVLFVGATAYGGRTFFNAFCFSFHLILLTLLRMKSLIENILRNLGNVPMLYALPPLIVGIAVGEWLAMPLWCGAVVLLLSLIVATLRPRQRYILLAIFAAGLFSISLRATPPLPAQGEMEIKVGRIVSRSTERTVAEGRVVAFIHDGKRYRSHADIRLTVSDVAIEQGDRLLAIATTRPFSHDNPIHRYMAAQGFAAQLYLARSDILRHVHSDRGFIRSLQERARQRIEALHLSPDVEAIARTIAIGERGAITPSLREAYTRSGGAHLLAVSGLHVGFLCLLLNLLLLPVTLLREGQVLRSALVVALIWLYAAVANFSPSVVRAATMFSIMQVATMTYSSVRGLNSLSLAAFLMLALDARTLHDAGFLLSVISVAAILLWVAPYAHLPKLENYYRPRWHDALWRVGQSLYAAVAVSIAATVATQPLVSHLFGSMSLWSVVLSPIIIPLCGVAMGATMVWVLVPLPMLEGVARWAIEHAAGAMNALAQWAAESDRLSLDVTIGRGWCIAIYILLILFTLLLLAQRPQKNRPTKS